MGMKDMEKIKKLVKEKVSCVQFVKGWNKQIESEKIFMKFAIENIGNIEETWEPTVAVLGDRIKDVHNATRLIEYFSLLIENQEQGIEIIDENLKEIVPNYPLTMICDSVGMIHDIAFVKKEMGYDISIIIPPALVKSDVDNIRLVSLAKGVKINKNISPSQEEHPKGGLPTITLKGLTIGGAMKNDETDKIKEASKRDNVRGVA